jgi:hypothetical protein
MPQSEKVTYDGYFNCSPECWVLFEEVLAVSSGDPEKYAPVHQLTIDAYAAQHAGGRHPDRSVLVHLAGLHAAFELQMPWADVPAMLKQLAVRVPAWPHLVPPEFPSPLTILEVALAEGPADHVARVGSWANSVWHSWADQHDTVARLVKAHGLQPRRGA